MKLFTAQHLSHAQLVEHARVIDMQIKKLDRRGAHITPPEQALATELKKLRLALKDRLDALAVGTRKVAYASAS
ncbi:MAG: DUF465 domain-containing protein [Myxococcales bacterium]|jgi:uncharacterized protein YdcH (DUF465 family)|nr:DUF465 domain-containing protein [Myxococcales bacterium]